MEKKQRLEKAKTQEMLKDSMSRAKSVVFVDFRGVSVADDTKLRRACREAKVTYKVAKNTLAARAIDSLGWEKPRAMLEGPTAIAMSELDPTAAPRVLANAGKDIPTLKIKGGMLDGAVLSPDMVMHLATLPSREQLLAQVAGSLKSPVASLVTVLGNTLGGFARAVEALRVKREEAAD